MGLITEQSFFGSGELWGIGTDALSTPSQFGTLQDVSIEFAMTQKELRGSKLFAEKTANSEAKVTGKAKFGRIDPVMFNNLYFGGSLVAGRARNISEEAGTIPAPAGPYTLVVANAANFKDDHGVTDQVTGNPLEKVAAAPATGQYSVNVATGTYTVAAADAGKKVLFAYSYQDAATGRTLSVTNTLAGLSPTFEIVLKEVNDDGEIGMKLYACTSNKLSLATKLGDYMIPEFDFTAKANAGGNVFDLMTE
ncbi:MAG: hypothetical protein KGL35_14875 [Bradyrhizobium sp.]|nr:hypothetical protein [Bradyrhizobium sp.]